MLIQQKRGIQLIIDEIAQMANIKSIAKKEITPNTLRHTCAVILDKMDCK
jgi:hypothetical protein